MKPLSSSLVGITLGLLSAGFAPGQGLNVQPPRPPAAPQAPPRPTGPIEVVGIAAKVNGKVITTNQVYFMLAPIYGQLASQFPRRGAEFERQLKVAKDGILQDLIDRQIILDEFKELQKTSGANIKDNLVDEEIKRVVRTLYNGDQAKFQEELRKRRLTMDGYRRMTKDQVIVQAMRQNQFADAPPPLPNEIRQEYDLVKLELRDTTKDVISMKKIFIPLQARDNPAVTPDNQLGLAENLAAQIKAGKDFAELAKAHSQDAFAADGGVWKDVPRADLSPEFAAIVFAAKEGELLGPLEDPNGFTIVIPTKIVYGPPPPLDGKVHEMLEERVRRKKTSAQYERWIEGKRKRAMVEVKMK